MSIRIGVQMYTIRFQLKTQGDLEKAFRRCREMGAQCVQVYPVPGTPAAFLKELSDTYALPICTIHSPFDRIQNDLDRLAEEYRTFDCASIGISMMPGRYRAKGPEGTKAFAQFLNETGRKLLPYGMNLTYHNHAFELKPMGSQTLYSYLLENTEPYVHFTPDVYWIKVGGYEPEDILSKLAGRTRVLHLKDYRKGLFVPHMKEIGAGTLDFGAILENAEKAGVRDAVIELDWARKPWQSLENSLRHLGL